LKQKTIVISGINMVEGGIFTILDNCLQKMAVYSQNKEVNVIAFVHDQSKFNYPNIEYIEYPKSKKSWLLRLYYEYFYFKKFSKKIKPDVWLSLHDISPTVVAKRRFVYCHHPTVFYKPTLNDWKFDYKIGLFSLLYKFLYQINITKNTAVFVQQNWIKTEFESLFSIKNVIVSKPEYVEKITTETIELEKNKIHFLFPSFPRTFKNFEIIFEALQLLDESIIDKLTVHFTTIKDCPNKYSKHLFNKYGNQKEIYFWDTLNRDELLKLYNSVDCLIFPSKLETWGLPISEAKAFQKPMLLANMPYAKETVGIYDEVSFFEIDDPKELASLITKFVNKTIVFQGNKTEIEITNQLNNWFELFDFILKE